MRRAPRSMMIRALVTAAAAGTALLVPGAVVLHESAARPNDFVWQANGGLAKAAVAPVDYVWLNKTLAEPADYVWLNKPSAAPVDYVWLHGVPAAPADYVWQLGAKQSNVMASPAVHVRQRNAVVDRDAVSAEAV